jgi:outer membrane phospholipase A
MDPAWFLAGSGHDDGRTNDLLSDPENQLGFYVTLRVRAYGWGDGGSGLYGMFAQRSFWQPWIRHTSNVDNTFTPEVFLYFDRGIGWIKPSVKLAYVHQSNGLGSDASRTWNRWMGTLEFGDPHQDHFAFDVSLWVPFNLHDNPDIRRMQGDGRLILVWSPLSHDVYPDSPQVLSTRIASAMGLQGRVIKNLELAVIMHPVLFDDRLDWMPTFMLQYFVGRGESLMRYDRDTHSMRLGVAVYR